MLSCSYMTQPHFSVQDVDKLANLSRLAFTQEEKEKFAQEISGILAYVGQIQEVAGGTDSVGGADILAHRTESGHYIHKNVLREDISSDVLSQNNMQEKLNPEPQILVDAAPKHTDGYVQVKKILGGSQ